MSDVDREKHKNTQEKIQTQKSHMLSPDRYQLLLENMKEVVYLVDNTGIIQYLSPAVERLLEYSPAELIGQQILDHVHPDDRIELQSSFNRILDGETGGNEYRLLTKSRETRWIMTSSHPLYENNRIVGVQGVLTDITGLKTMGERIHREAKRNALLAELSRQLITSDSEESISAVIIEFAGKLTDSSDGYSGYIDPATNQILCPATLVNGQLIDHSPFTRFIMDDFRGLWNQIRQHRKPLISNTPVTDLKTLGVPEDHISIRRYLAVPAMLGETLIGQIAVANAPRDYTTTDISCLEQLANLFAITLHRRQSQQKLIHSEELYRTTIDGIDDMIHVVNPDLKIEMFNQSIVDNATMLTDFKKEITNCELFEIFPFLPEGVRDEYQHVISTGQSLRTEESNQVGDRLIWTDTNKIPLKDAAGNVQRIITIIRDITPQKTVETSLKSLTYDLEKRVEDRTRELAEKNASLHREIKERKKTEVALRESELTSRALLNAPTESAFLIALDGTIITLNETAASRLGHSIEALIGKNTREIFPSENFEIKESNGMKVLQTKKPVRYEDYRDGMWFDTTIYPVFDATGAITRWAVYARDITRQKKMEEELLKTQKLESIGVLAGGIAHDFNNILTGVLGYINMARMRSIENDAVNVLLQKAEKAALQTRDLTKQLLTFAGGGAPLIKTTVIGQLIRESAEFAARGSGIQCQFRIQPDLYPVEADEGQIKQVVNNLVINSGQAMSGGGIVMIQVSNESIEDPEVEWMEPGKYVKVSVSDCGPGISGENLTKIFDPYFTTKPNGTGLGLAVCYSIIKNHGGNITASSETGTGCTISFTIPASNKPYIPDPFGEEQVFQGSGNALVMDDEYYVLDVFAQMLTELGFDAELTADGSQAVNQFRKAHAVGSPFDIVFLDLTVPGTIGGVAAVKLMREINPGLRAVVTSGYSNDDVLANYSDYGFDDYIIKPFSIKELSRVLRRLLNQS